MAGMRDKLVHDYFGIDYDIVWDVVTNKVPELKDGATFNRCGKKMKATLHFP